MTRLPQIKVFQITKNYSMAKRATQVVAEPLISEIGNSPTNG